MPNNFLEGLEGFGLGVLGAGTDIVTGIGNNIEAGANQQLALAEAQSLQNQIAAQEANSKAENDKLLRASQAKMFQAVYLILIIGSLLFMGVFAYKQLK